MKIPYINLKKQYYSEKHKILNTIDKVIRRDNGLVDQKLKNLRKIFQKFVILNIVSL